MVAAFVNYLALIAVSVWLVAEAAARVANPPEVAGGLVMALAGFALLVDIATAALVFRSAQDSSNMRAAFLHNLADAGVSVAVLIGGALILAFGWYLADPLLTIAISVVILWHVLRELPPVWRTLMMASPPGADHARLLADVRAVPGVRDAHHLHLWQIDEKRTAVSVHIVADGPHVIATAKAMLRERHGIAHATMEFEPEEGLCADQDSVG